ncbi:MAG: transglycosylase domain-containing protein [Marinifilaceae bacterium]
MDETKEKRVKIKKRIIKLSIIGILGSILSLILFIVSIYFGIFGELPTYKELKNINNVESSKIYTADKKIMGKFFLENRTNLTYKDISPDIFNALIATEDSRFYEHNGIDTRSLLRVIFKTILLRDRSSGGGSTLSQQLAKNLYGRGSHSFLSMPISKLKEMFTASRLEKIYSKEGIITLYLNTVPFGENVYGIESAAQRFFSKSAADVSTIEAATLVGMLKASTSYNPRLHPKRSTSRRNTVINQMVKHKDLTKEKGELLKKMPLVIKYKRLSNNEGLATYLRENLRHEVKSIVKKFNKENDSKINMYSDGLKIYTTIDSHLQKYAEEAVNQHMKSLQKTFYKHWKKREPWYNNRLILKSALKRSQRYKHLKKLKKSDKEITKIFNTKVNMEIYSSKDGDKDVKMSPMDSIKHYLKILHTGFIAVNPQNGQIRAWVGGIDHKYFKYDMVKAERQTGSIFKPIVFAAALENGEDPNSYYSNEIEADKEHQGWKPRDSHSNDSIRYYSMRGALAHSVNTVAVKVLMKTGIDETIQMAQDLGIRSELSRFPSMALGVSNSSLLEMAQVFSTFANSGEWVKPYYITKVTDKAGNIIYEKKDIERHIVMSSENAAIMNFMLEGVVNNGTGRRLRGRYGLRNCIAGKTGTTQNNADGWFFGYNPHIVAGVRTGANDMRVHFRSTYLGQGANTALPIFGLFMQKALKDPRFSHWNRIQFPSLSILNTLEKDAPLYKKSLDVTREMKTDSIININRERVKYYNRDVKKAKKKKTSIWFKIKSIFKKKDK